MLRAVAARCALLAIALGWGVARVGVVAYCTSYVRKLWLSGWLGERPALKYLAIFNP